MGQLLIVFLPFMAHGHMIPTLDMAKLFNSRGVKTIIISTAEFADPIKKARESGHDIGLSILKFPPEGSDLPDTCVSFDHIMAANEDLLPKFVEALSMLQEPVEKLLEEFRPNCLVADMFLPWTTDSAAKLGIPRMVFHGVSTFALCASEQMKRHKPYENVASDSEPFLLPNLPHQLKFVKTQVHPHELEEKESAFTQLRVQMRDAEERSYGVLVNSFYELEPDYADHYKNVLGRRTWHIGPLLLHNKEDVAKARRGKESAIDEDECKAWLDSKKPNSVVYVCFGSMATFTSAQLRETAIGLEASGQDFIWVVRRGKNDEGNNDFLPDGYEERVKGKSLIIRGWAPQVLILNHPSIGAFVTHCGWNSTLEGVCAGVPMVTWPVFAEQFYNEKLLTEVLRIGVSVGNRHWRRSGSDGVPSKAVAKAVQSVIKGEEAPEMRSRAKKLKEMARNAVEEVGSSHKELSSLMEELSMYRPPSNQV